MLVEKDGGKLALDYQRKDSIGKVKAFNGNFGVLVRALAYILAYGPGVRQATEDAVLNANYIRKGLEGVFDLALHAPIDARSGIQRRDPKEKWREHHGHRQAPNRLWLPSLYDSFSINCPRRVDDRAH